MLKRKSSDAPASRPPWCKACKQDYSEECVEAGHRPWTQKQLRLQDEAGDRLVQLKRGVTAQARLRQHLAAAERELAQGGHELRVLAALQLEQAAARLRAATDSPATAGLEGHLQAAARLAKKIPALEDAAWLLDFEGKCTIVVEEDGGARWEASERMELPAAADSDSDSAGSVEEVDPSHGHVLLRHLLVEWMLHGYLKKKPSKVTSAAEGPSSKPAKIATPAPLAGHQPKDIPTKPQTKPQPQPQRVRIFKSTDGRIQVEGLRPGQKLLQMPDGKLQVLDTHQSPALAKALAPPKATKGAPQATAAAASVAGATRSKRHGATTSTVTGKSDSVSTLPAPLSVSYKVVIVNGKPVVVKLPEKPASERQQTPVKEETADTKPSGSTETKVTATEPTATEIDLSSLHPSLEDKLQLSKVRKLSGVDGAYLEQLLRRVEGLEELEVSSPRLEHMSAVSGLASLRRLDVTMPWGTRLPRCPPLPENLRELRMHYASSDYLRLIESHTSLLELDVKLYDEHFAEADAAAASMSVVVAAAPLALPPQLQELRVENCSEALLAASQRIPGLHSLTVSHYLGPTLAATAVPAPAADHCGLRRLHVELLAKDQAVVFALIAAHAESLDELHVTCCSQPEDAVSDWQMSSFAEMPARLRELRGLGGLRALRRLVLRRKWSGSSETSPAQRHFPASCRAQVTDLKQALADGGAQAAQVLCSDCDGVAPGWA